jgi:hypothetical protein
MLALLMQDLMELLRLKVLLYVAVVVVNMEVVVVLLNPH